MAAAERAVDNDPVAGLELLVLAELYIIKGKDAGKYVKLGNEPFVFLGRSITNQVPVDDREVSRVHCRIEVTARGCILRDLASGNGTYVNEERAQERVLDDGDLVRLGKTVIAVLVESPEEQADWRSFVGLGESSEIALSGSSSGELAIDPGTVEGATPVSAPIVNPAEPATRITALTKSEAEPPAPFSTEEEQDIEASGLRGRKNRVSLRNLIPGFVIERKMGGSRSSSQAVIYKAFQQSLERSVAIKTLLARGDTRDKAARRFMREVSQVARLPHTNIVVIHDAGRVKNFYYFVMEYLAGGSILDLVADNKPRAIAQALRMTHEIARALAYIHDHGIMHRGVNPGCILLDTATGMSKLCGFGFAKQMEMSAGDTTYLTAPLEGFSFLSPEQILGKETTTRADIYSLGATLWYMLAGRMPVQGKNHIEISGNILEGRIPPIQEIVPDVPDEVASIIHNCLAIEAEARFDNAEALARALLHARLKHGDGGLALSGGTAAYEL